ncbi:MAG TPA: hypothetical protein VF574_02290 [Allosphingosinicella sp.]|jgi:hypothetical protein
MGVFGATLVGLLLLAEQKPVIITSGNTVKPPHHQTDYESACGSNVFRVRFRNGPEEEGHVDRFLIDGIPVRDAAETLQILAARRWIQAIEIMNCGDDPRRPVFRGATRLSKSASQVAHLRDTLFSA